MPCRVRFGPLLTGPLLTGPFPLSRDSMSTRRLVVTFPVPAARWPLALTPVFFLARVRGVRILHFHVLLGAIQFSPRASVLRRPADALQPFRPAGCPTLIRTHDRDRRGGSFACFEFLSKATPRLDHSTVASVAMKNKVLSDHSLSVVCKFFCSWSRDYTAACGYARCSTESARSRLAWRPSGQVRTDPAACGDPCFLPAVTEKNPQVASHSGPMRCVQSASTRSVKGIVAIGAQGA